MILQSGKLFPSAHMIDREYRLIKALDGQVPLPKVLDYVENVLDTPFYLMNYCHGRVFLDPKINQISKKNRKNYYEEMIRVLAKIHNVDYKTAGLADFGKESKNFA